MQSIAFLALNVINNISEKRTALFKPDSQLIKYLNKATGRHFDQPGHRISDMQVTIIEKVHNSDINFRKNREKMYIQKFNTKYKGLNQNC